MVSFAVGCASASNDNKITGRQITANQHLHLDMLTALLRVGSSTDRVDLLALLFDTGACAACYA